jgi:hypothetical protein
MFTFNVLLFAFNVLLFAFYVPFDEIGIYSELMELTDRCV